jgi:hypothetical protein
LLWSQDMEASRYNLASAQNPYLALRPQLVIDYILVPGWH